MTTCWLLVASLLGANPPVPVFSDETLSHAVRDYVAVTLPNTVPAASDAGTREPAPPEAPAPVASTSGPPSIVRSGPGGTLEVEVTVEEERRDPRTTPIYPDLLPVGYDRLPLWVRSMVGLPQAGLQNTPSFDLMSQQYWWE